MRVRHSALHKTFYLVLMWLLTAVISASSSLASEHAQTRCWSVDEGLASSMVHANAIDADGFIWFATGDGLSRYDGFEFRTFKHSYDSDAGLAGNRLRSLLTDKRGNVWIGGAALSRYDTVRSDFSRFNLFDGAAIESIYQDAFGSIWVAGSRIGFAKVNADTGELIAHYTKANSNLTNNAVYAVSGDGNGNLWLATASGIAFWDALNERLRNLTPAGYAMHLAVDSVRDILVDSQGYVWVATSHGLFQYTPNNDQWRHFEHDPGNASSLPTNQLWSVFQTRSGDIWVGTDKHGISRYLPSDQAFEHVVSGDSSDQIPIGPIFDFSEDPSGGLWLSVYNNGVCRVDPKGKPFTLYKRRADQRNGLSVNMISAIHADKKGRIWLATNGGGLNLFEPRAGTFTHYRHDPTNPKTISSDSVFGIAEDSFGYLWLGTWQGGLNRFDPSSGEFQSYTLPVDTNLNSDRSNILFVGFDAAGQLWLSVWDKGLYRFDVVQKRFIAYTPDAQGVPFTLANLHINTVHFDTLGAMWVGGHDGLTRIDTINNSVVDIALDQYSDVYDIHESADGILWLATSAGLLRYDPRLGQKQAFGVQQGLPADYIVGIEADDAGNLWLATRNGLAKFNPDNFSAQVYGVSDGLQSREFNRFSHAKAEDGTLYFGGTHGFNAFKPSKVVKDAYRPKVYITDLHVANQRLEADLQGPLERAVAHTDKVFLAPDQTDLRFEFTGIHYAAPDTLRYRYRLLGYERNWRIAPVGTRSVDYRALRPGAYLFEVQAGSGTAVWNTKGAAIEVYIASPWWNNRWLQLGMALISAALLYLFWRMRTYSERRRQWQMEELIELKSNELNVALAQLELSNNILESKVKERTLEYQQEIAVRRNAEKTLIHRATHDALTGLPNRTWLRQHLQNRLEQWRRAAGKPFALLYLDGDQFKLVNDSIGHLVGDKLLIAVAKRLLASLPSNAHVSRQGGDEFVIILDEVNHMTDVEALAQTVLEAMMQPFYIDDIELFFNVSIGVVMSADYYNRPEDILRDADIAMYHAKAQGKACYAVFDEAMHADAELELNIINGLKQAVEKSQLYLMYQPIVTLSDGSLAGFESLMRWNWEGHDPIGPDKFIPIAESNGLIAELGSWALAEACAQYKRWPQPPLFLGVNVSPRQLTSGHICEEVSRLLEVHNIPASAIKLEITETALMENAAQARNVLKELERRQIQLAIDDFGAGYSSLSYLQELPVQHLKIDRSFIVKIGSDAGAREIVKTIISLAHSLGMKTIAEGIESQQDVDILRDLGCDLGQGYWFAKPLSAVVAQQWLMR